MAGTFEPRILGEKLLDKSATFIQGVVPSYPREGDSNKEYVTQVTTNKQRGNLTFRLSKIGCNVQIVPEYDQLRHSETCSKLGNALFVTRTGNIQDL